MNKKQINKILKIFKDNKVMLIAKDEIPDILHLREIEILKDWLYNLLEEVK